eukprot:4584327-Pleurochrysis_carterae.AAC.5
MKGLVSSTAPVRALACSAETCCSQHASRSALLVRSKCACEESDSLPPEPLPASNDLSCLFANRDAGARTSAPPSLSPRSSAPMHFYICLLSLYRALRAARPSNPSEAAAPPRPTQLTCAKADTRCTDACTSARTNADAKSNANRQSPTPTSSPRPA